MFKFIFSGIFARLTASIVQALTLILITTYTGPADFGRFAAISASFVMVSIFFGLGLDSQALRLQAYKSPRSAGGTIGVLRYPVLFLTILGTALITVSFGSVKTNIIIFAIAFAAFESIATSVESIMYGLQRAKRAQTALVARRLYLLVVVFIGTVIDNVYYVSTVASVLGIIFFPLFLSDLVQKPANFKEILKGSLKFWGPTMVAKIQTLDTLLATFLLTPIAAGIYSAASRITSPLNIFAAATLSIMTPEITSAVTLKEKIRTFKRGRKLVLIVAPTLLLISPVVGWVTQLVLGDAYRNVWAPATVLAVSTAFAAVSQAYISFFYSINKPNVIAIRRIISLIIGLASAPYLTTHFGATGLALAYLCFQLMFMFFIVIKQLPKTHTNEQSL